MQSTSTSHFEVIVCDDGSAESLKHVVVEFQNSIPHLRYLRQEHRGPAAARNMGIVHSVTDIVVFLDTDTDPDRHLICELIRAMTDHPKWQGAAAALTIVTDEDTLRWEAPPTAGCGHYHTAGVAYRTDVLRCVGGLDEGFLSASCEGVDLAVRVLEQGKIETAPNAIVYRSLGDRSAASCWKARKHWRFVRIVACRYGFLAWRNQQTRFPRIRTAVAASVLHPLNRLWMAVKLINRTPQESIRGMFLSIVSWIGGVSMLPSILFEATPCRLSGVGKRDSHQTQSTALWMNDQAA